MDKISCIPLKFKGFRFCENFVKKSEILKTVDLSTKKRAPFLERVFSIYFYFFI